MEQQKVTTEELILLHKYISDKAAAERLGHKTLNTIAYWDNRKSSIESMLKVRIDIIDKDWTMHTNY